MAKVDLPAIIHAARQTLEAQIAAEPLSEVKQRIADAPPVRSFKQALASGQGIVAEIKDRSPSMGNMRAENVAAAPRAYAQAEIVRAVSVLTNEEFFGGTLDRVARFKEEIKKPILRKDFVFEAYQIYQSRAAGADALLLMVNVIEDPAKIKALFELTKELGMDALIETHTPAEIEAVADFADIMGINSRNFKAEEGFDEASRTEAGGDSSIDLGVFGHVQHLPAETIKIAESGIHSATDLKKVYAGGFHAALIGTAFLTCEDGIDAKLAEFNLKA